MENFKSTPRSMLKSLYSNRMLIFSLVQREISGRYKGSLLGGVWSFITPVMMLAMYTFVFSYVFKARWGDGGGGKAEFALILFSGLIVFNVVSECLMKAPQLIVGNSSYVKKIVFPLEILVWVSLGAAFFHMMISLMVWVLAYLLLIGVPNFTILLFPVVMLPLYLFVIGISWILSSIGVFLKDVGQFIAVFISIMMFMTPIFYPITALPIKLQKWLYINPLTSLVDMSRDVLFFGKLPSLELWILMLIVCGTIASLGYAWFQKTRMGFADVM